MGAPRTVEEARQAELVRSNMPNWLTKDEAAAAARRSPKAIARWALAGVIVTERRWVGEDGAQRLRLMVDGDSLRAYLRHEVPRGPKLSDPVGELEKIEAELRRIHGSLEWALRRLPAGDPEAEAMHAHISALSARIDVANARLNRAIATHPDRRVAGHP